MYLMYKLYHRYVSTGKSTVHTQRVQYYPVSGLHWEPWNVSPAGKGGTTILSILIPKAFQVTKFIATVPIIYNEQTMGYKCLVLVQYITGA